MIMKIVDGDEDYLVIDFKNKSIKGRTTKRNLSSQIKTLKEILK